MTKIVFYYKMALLCVIIIENVYKTRLHSCFYCVFYV